AEKPEEVKPILEKAFFTPGPAIVDVVVDREENCFPMIPAGAAIKDIIDFGEPVPDKLFQGWR
ncbi:MAG: acetolactate synthase large subunit, partial [Candidatus Methylomirabilales bacterium]